MVYMEKKINKKAIVYKGGSSIFIFVYPFLLFCLMSLYTIKNLNINNSIISILICLAMFIPAFLNFKKKSMLVTKNSIYVFNGEKKIIHWSIQKDFYQFKFLKIN